MKNRRIMVVALILVAVLCVGVGYAELNDTLNATGTINYNPTFALAWGEVAANDVVTGEPVIEGKNLTFTIDATDWTTEDAARSFTVTVKNTSKYDAENVVIQELNTTDVQPYFTVTSTIDSTTIPAGGTATVTITIEMDSYPLTATAYSETFTFSVYGEQKTDA